MARNILIIGKTGQVATQLQAACTKSEVEFFCVDRQQLDLALLNDISSVQRLIDQYEVWAVLNAAAHTAVDQAESEPDLAMAINSRAPGILAKACAKSDIALIHISTDFVFDGTSKTPYREDDVTAPLSVYGRTKRDGENAIRDTGCTHAILRTAWVFSPTGKNFVKTMLRLGSEREKLTIVADQIGCPTPASAIAAAMVRVATELVTKPEKSGTYHFVGDQPTSWAGFARAIFKTAGLTTQIDDIKTEQFPTPARRPAFSVLDCTRIKDSFGITQPNWRDTLTDTISSLNGST